MAERTLNAESGVLFFSIASLAETASLRLIILTKAWRLSLLTIQVWTWPYRSKMFLKSCSDILSILAEPKLGLGRNLRDTANEESSAEH